MAEWKQAEWRKSHRRGVTSESLIGIGPNARALFWTLFTCAWWDEESPEGRLLESPDPTDAKSIEALGAMSDLTQGQARAALEKLQRKHIVAVDEHGVVTLPKFRKWQRGESYERVKKHRDDRFRNGPATPVETDIAESRQQKQTAEPPPPEGSGEGQGKKQGAKKPAKQLDVRAETVLSRIDSHRVAVGLPAMGPTARTDKTLLCRFREGATVEQALAVADVFGALAKRDPAKRTLLNATTPFTGPSSDGERGGGWAWGLRMIDESRGPGPRGSSSTSTDLFLDDL